MMALIETKIDEDEGTITFVMDLETPTLSKSGKRLLIASTRGTQPTGQHIGDREIEVSLNAMIKP